MTTLAANRRVFIRLALIATAMFGFGYALVPMYYRICEYTGVNKGEEQYLAKGGAVDAGRQVLVQFDANNGKDMPWRFRPLTLSVRVHPGALGEMFYEIENLTDQTITGQAIPSYAPAQAGAFFKKIECFCFKEQSLAPHEKRRLPLLFVLDTKMPKDLNTVTLSYTFYRKGTS